MSIRIRIQWFEWFIPDLMSKLFVRHMELYEIMVDI